MDFEDLPAFDRCHQRTIIFMFMLLRIFLLVMPLLLCRSALAAGPDLEALHARAEHGEAPFQAYFGFLYLNGQGGVKQNYEESFKWYHRAAEQGYPAAEYNVGVMYDEGKGVEQSHAAAFFWLSLAASAAPGNKDYASRRDQVGFLLPMAQAEDITARTKAWRPNAEGAPAPAATTATATAVTQPSTLAPGTPLPWFQLPPQVQKTVNDNVHSGWMIGKIDKAVEDGILVYRAQVNKEGSAPNIIRVDGAGHLVSVSRLGGQ